MKSFLVWFVSLVAVGISLFWTSPVLADTLNFDNPSDALIGPGEWNLYISATTSFGINSTNFAPNNVLQIGLTAAGWSPTKKQGFSRDTAGPVMSVWCDFYVDSVDWSGQNVYSGMWASNSDSLFPSALVFQQSSTGASTTGFYDFDNSLNGYTFISAGQDGWNNLRMDLNPGVGIDYFVNGVKSGFTADTGLSQFDFLALVSQNYRLDQTFYYDNVGSGSLGAVNSTPVPLPTSVWMGGSMMLVWLGIWVFPKSRRLLVQG